MSAYRTALAEYRQLPRSDRIAYKEKWRTVLQYARRRRDADHVYMQIMKPQEGAASIFTLAFDMLTAPWALMFRRGFGSDYLWLARYVWMFAVPLLILKILDAPGPAHPYVFVLIVSSVLAWWHTLETYNLWNQSPPSWPGISNIALLFGLGSNSPAKQTQRLWVYNCLADGVLTLFLFALLARVNTGASSLWIDGFLRLYLMAGAAGFIVRNFWEMGIIVKRRLYVEVMNHKEQIERSDLQAKVQAHEVSRNDDIPRVSTVDENDIAHVPEALLTPEPLTELAPDLQKLLAEGLATADDAMPQVAISSETPDPYAVDDNNSADSGEKESHEP